MFDDEIRTQLAEGLELAIKGENDGYHFYKMAAQNTSDEKGRDVFETLAAEELNHFTFLKAQYVSVTTTGELDKTVNLGPKSEFSDMSPIFSESLKERIADAHFEMSALSIGIQLELNAIKFYQSQADMALGEAATAFYKDLVEWEQGHYDMLHKQQQLLQDDYWSAGGFAPF